MYNLKIKNWGRLQCTKSQIQSEQKPYNKRNCTVLKKSSLSSSQSSLPAPPSGWSGLVPYSRWMSCYIWTLGLQPAPDEQRLLERHQSCPQLRPEKNEINQTWKHLAHGRASQDIRGLQNQGFYKWLDKSLEKTTGFLLVVANKSCMKFNFLLTYILK